MKALEGQYRLSDLCAALDVSRSGYHAWKARPPSARSRTDAELGRQLCQAHTQSRQTYGSPRLLEALQKKGLRTSRRRVCRLMRQHELRGTVPRAFRPQTTDSRHDQPIAPNLMAAAAAPTGPNQIWVSDITYVRTDSSPANPLRKHCFPKKARPCSPSATNAPLAALPKSSTLNST